MVWHGPGGQLWATPSGRVEVTDFPQGPGWTFPNGRKASILKGSGRAGLAIFPCTSQESQQTTVKAALFLNIARVFTAPTVGDFP